MTRLVAFFLSFIYYLIIVQKHVKIQFFNIWKFYIWWPWHSPSHKFIHFSIEFVYLYVVLIACNTCFLISVHLPIQILLQNMRKYQILKKNHEKNYLWPWPLIKSFFIQFFIVSNRRHISCYIHINVVFFCTPLQKLSKTTSKYVKLPFFHIMVIVKICLF